MSNFNSINNGGVPYYFPADIAKEGQQYARFSNWLKTRVNDNGKKVPVKWYDQGRVMNVNGLTPFIEGMVGHFTTDENDELIPSSDVVPRDWQGSSADVTDGGLAFYTLEDQFFCQEGQFKGIFGLRDGNGNVYTSVNIVFEILGNDLRMGETTKYYSSKLDKMVQEFHERTDQVLRDLQKDIISCLDEYKGTISYNSAALQKLAAVASSINAELTASDVANKQDFEKLKNDIINKLGSIQPEPVVFTNLESLEKQYPEGSNGIFITADDHCLAFFDGSKWKKGSQFQLSSITLLQSNLLQQNTDAELSLINQNNGQAVYTYYSEKGMWNVDNRFTQICQLPKGLVHWSVALESQAGAQPILLIAELQDDGTYLSKSLINLKLGTGEKTLSTFNYKVNNQNTYAFIGGNANIFKFDSANVPINRFIQVEAAGVGLNQKIEATDITSSQGINLAGINISIFGYQDESNCYTNLSNEFLTEKTSSNNHYWSVLSFKAGNFLDKAVIKSDNNDVTLEIREFINGKYVLKKHVSATSFDNGISEFKLNYLAKNNGRLFVSGHIDYAFDTSGSLLEYDATAEDLELNPTQNAHALLLKADIFTDSSKLYKSLSQLAADNAFDKITNENSNLIYSNLDNPKLDLVPDQSRFSGHHWNVLSFKSGDSLGRVLTRSNNNDVTLEIREFINGKYVLQKHVNATSFNNGISEFQLDYLAKNDGVLFVSGTVHYSIGESGQFLEYTNSEESVAITPSTNNSFVWAMDVYQKEPLFNKLFIEAISDNEKRKKANQVEDTIARLNNKQHWIPRLVQTNDDFCLSGRWYTKVIDGKEYHVTNNCGAQIYFEVSNATYFNIDWKSMYSNDYARWAYSIDGSEFNSISTSQTRVDLPDTSKHIIQIVTDAIYQDLGKWQGNGFAFSKIDTDGTTRGLHPYNPMIMYYGDSITEGIRTLGMDEKGPGCSVLSAYSWLSAKQLNAQPYIVGYGGSGLFTKGSFNTTNYSVDWMAQGIAETDIKPNLIVINIGTNDHVSNEQFASAYNALLKKIMIKYPGVLVACMIPFNQTYYSAITNVVENMPNCVLIPTKDWEVTTTDGTHPDKKGSLIAATRLANKLDDLGASWRVPILVDDKE